jgi:hypothetical protein
VAATKYVISKAAQLQPATTAAVPTTNAAIAPVLESAFILRAPNADMALATAPRINRTKTLVSCNYLAFLRKSEIHKGVSCLKAIRATVSLPSPPTN